MTTGLITPFRVCYNTGLLPPPYRSMATVNHGFTLPSSPAKPIDFSFTACPLRGLCEVCKPTKGAPAVKGIFSTENPHTNFTAHTGPLSADGLKQLLRVTEAELPGSAQSGYQRIAGELTNRLMSFDERERQVIVIQGVSGAGKSSLCAYLYNEWYVRTGEVPSFIELDGLLRPIEERMAFWRTLEESNAPENIDMCEQNYDMDRVQAFLAELQAHIKMSRKPDQRGGVRRLAVDASDKHTGETVPVFVDTRRTIFIVNEYGAHFAGQYLRDLKPICISLEPGPDKAVFRFLERTKRTYRDRGDVSDGSAFMSQREFLARANRATYDRLLAQYDKQIRFKIDISGEPETWKVNL